MMKMLIAALILAPGLALAVEPGGPGWFKGPVAPYPGGMPTGAPMPVSRLPEYKPACLAPMADGSYALVFVNRYKTYVVPMPAVVRPGFILEFQGKNLERCH